MLTPYCFLLNWTMESVARWTRPCLRDIGDPSGSGVRFLRFPLITMAEATKLRNARDVATRWTPALSRNWTPISDFFLDNYHRLSPPIKYQEAMLIIHLMRHKWDAAAPHPGFPTLAKRMGISPQAARLHARSLETNGYLSREMRVGETNRFHLNKLFAALERLMQADASHNLAQTSERLQLAGG